MKKLFFTALLFLPASLLYSQLITKIFIVCHAERTAGDDLTPAGLAQAQLLKSVFGGAGINRIYSTDYERTRKTAKPLADSLGLTTAHYPSNADLITTIKSTGAGRRHFVVGHSDTVIDFITRCGCRPPTGLATGIPGSQFDNLFQVLLTKTGAGWTCEVMRLRYGAPAD